MTNRALKLLGAAALAAGLTFAQTATAPTAPAQGGGRGQFMINHATKALNLTTDQQSGLQQIITNFRTASQPLHQQLRSDETALMNAAKANPSADLTEQANAVAQDMAKLSVLRAQAFGQFYASLNAQQKQQVDSFGDHLPMFGGAGFGHGR